MRLLTVAILAAFLGSATVADAQVFKRRGKGGSTAKAKTPAKKPATKTAAKTKPTKATAAKKPAKGSKVAAARPSDLTPDPVDADTDYVLIEDLDE